MKILKLIVQCKFPILYFFLFGSLLFFSFSPAYSQEKSFFLSPSHLLGSAISGVYDPMSEKINWSGVSILTTTAISSSLFHYFLDDPSSGRISQSSHPSWVSSVGSFAPLSLPLFFWGFSQFQTHESTEYNQSLTTAKLLTQTLALTLTTSYALKYGLNSHSEKNSSLLSGQTSLAFASAGVLAYQYSWPIGLLSFLGAASLGYFKVDGKLSLASEVAMGAGIGVFFASSVTYYHRKVSKDFRSSVPPVLPYVENHSAGISFNQGF